MPQIILYKHFWTEQKTREINASSTAVPEMQNPAQAQKEYNQFMVRLTNGR